MEHNAFFKTHGLLIGRILMGLLFVLAGINKLTGEAGVAATAGMIEGVGLPAPMLLAWLTVAVEIGGGAALILGYQARKAAMLLAGFALLTIVFFHRSIEDVNLTKNLAIVGGLLYVIAFGVGDTWSLQKEERREKNADPVPSL